MAVSWIRIATTGLIAVGVLFVVSRMGPRRDPTWFLRSGDDSSTNALPDSTHTKPASHHNHYDDIDSNPLYPEGSNAASPVVGGIPSSSPSWMTSGAETYNNDNLADEGNHKDTAVSQTPSDEASTYPPSLTPSEPEITITEVPTIKTTLAPQSATIKESSSPTRTPIPVETLPQNGTRPFDELEPDDAVTMENKTQSGLSTNKSYNATVSENLTAAASASPTLAPVEIPLSENSTPKQTAAPSINAMIDNSSKKNESINTLPNEGMKHTGTSEEPSMNNTQKGIDQNSSDNTATVSLPPLPYLPETAHVVSTTLHDADYEHIVNYHGTDEVQAMAHELMVGRFTNQALGGAWLEHRNKTLVNITFSCQDIFEHSGMGTGNFVAAFYGVRLIARALDNVSVSIHCPDAEETKAELVLPWLTGFFPAVQHSVPPVNRTRPAVSEACTHFGKISLGYMIPSMRYDLRRMALALVGSRDGVEMDEVLRDNSPPDGAVMHISVDQAAVQDPVYVDEELDDAIVHFRCGDLMDSDHPSFGFIKFRSFSRHITPTVQSIGIATQPFDAVDAQQRPSERNPTNLDRCRLVVIDFVFHLKDHFPDARVSIRNEINETIALTYARMVMANQTVSPISSFSVIPALSTFGTGYIRNPDFKKAPNRFLLYPNVSTLVDNVYLIDEPVLMAKEVKEMWGDDGADVLEWFRGEDEDF